MLYFSLIINYCIGTVGMSLYMAVFHKLMVLVLYPFSPPEALHYWLFHHLLLCPLSACAELVGENILSIQSSEKVTSISLPPTPPYHTLEFQLEVLCIIPSGFDRPANERLTNGEVRHRPRSYSHPDTPMTAIDQRVRQTNLYF